MKPAQIHQPLTQRRAWHRDKRRISVYLTFWPEHDRDVSGVRSVDRPKL